MIKLYITFVTRLCVVFFSCLKFLNKNKQKFMNELFINYDSLNNLVLSIPDYSQAINIITNSSYAKDYTLPEDGFIYYRVTGNSTLMITATINNKNGYRFGGRAEANYAVGGLVYMPKGTYIKPITNSTDYELEFIPLKKTN